MNSQYNSEGFLNDCAKGNLDLIKRKLNDGVDINYKDKANQNSAAHHACINNQLEQGFNFQNDLRNAQGNTPLHIACENSNFQIILFLLMNQMDPTVKNSKGQKPGEGNPQVRAFIMNIIPQKKAFNALKPIHKEKLLHIFNELDHDKTNLLDFHKALRCNKYLEDVSDPVAQKDAKDFIKSVAICNRQTVNIEEWYFSFAKSLVCDQVGFNKFLDDYEKKEKQRGSLRDQPI